jgi:hypothetical protein
MVAESCNRMLLTSITEFCNIPAMDWKSHIQSLISFGWTVDDLAVRMGVTPNAVREIIAGRTKAPRAEAAMKLAAIAPSETPPQLAA